MAPLPPDLCGCDLWAGAPLTDALRALWRAIRGGAERRMPPGLPAHGRAGEAQNGASGLGTRGASASAEYCAVGGCLPTLSFRQKPLVLQGQTHATG
jgi:hypothetical protein